MKEISLEPARTDIEAMRSFIVQSFLLGAGDELEDSTPLMEAGILDSTGVVELVSFLEKQFNISIADEEITAENLNSLENMARFVASKSR